MRSGVPTALRLVGDRADVIVSTLSFALGSAGDGAATPPLERLGVPIVQAITSGTPREAWEVSHRGLTPLDTAINVAIPEIDGRIVSVPISFKDRAEDAPGLYAPHADRIARVAGLAAAFARLRRRPRADVRVAFVLTNSSSKASQIGNAVGLDAPASLLTVLRAMRRDGYTVSGLPATGDELMADLLARGSYDEQHPLDPALAQRLSRAALPRRVQPPLRRGAPAHGGVVGHAGRPRRHPAQRRAAHRQEDRLEEPRPARTFRRREPWSDDGDYLFAAMEIGNAIVALQPPRGYGMNPMRSTTRPTCRRRTTTRPSIAGWRRRWRRAGGEPTPSSMSASTARSSGCPARASACRPTAIRTHCSASLPLVYPFIVNDPGEGSQAKRRAHAVIVDHLMPPMTNAGHVRAARNAERSGQRVLHGREARPVEAADRPAADLGARSSKPNSRPTST